jgi:hypothetical protein
MATAPFEPVQRDVVVYASIADEVGSVRLQALHDMRQAVAQGVTVERLRPGWSVDDGLPKELTISPRSGRRTRVEVTFSARAGLPLRSGRSACLFSHGRFDLALSLSPDGR